MTKKIFSVLFSFCIFLIALGSLKAEAFEFEKLFYFREGPLARKSLFSNPKSIDIFAPQNYMINDDGFLSGSVKPDLLSFTKKNKIAVMPLLTNGSFNATTSRIFLNDTLKQDNLIKALVQESKDFDYIGWQIDFEQMDLSLRDKFSEFIERTYKVFQKNNLQLSVAVIAQISENPEGYPKNLWQRIIGVYDYSRLASSTDFISLMSYDDPNSLGPVTGYKWLNQVIDFSLTKIPKEKISLGLGLYYWQRRHIDGKLIGIGGNEGIDNVIKKYKVYYYFSDEERVPYFHYWKEGKGYTIWYENARSVSKKVDLIKLNELRGFSAWALGLELPSIHNVI